MLTGIFLIVAFGRMPKDRFAKLHAGAHHTIG
jgi:hypothetical protein